MQRNFFATAYYSPEDLYQIISNSNEPNHSFDIINRHQEILKTATSELLINMITKIIDQTILHLEKGVEYNVNKIDMTIKNLLETNKLLSNILSPKLSFDHLVNLLSSIGGGFLSGSLERKLRKQLSLSLANNLRFCIPDGKSLNHILLHLSKKDKRSFIENQEQFWHEATIKKCQMTFMSAKLIDNKNSFLHYFLNHGGNKYLQRKILELAGLVPQSFLSESENEENSKRRKI